MTTHSSGRRFSVFLRYVYTLAGEWGTGSHPLVLPSIGVSRQCTGFGKTKRPQASKSLNCELSLSLLKRGEARAGLGRVPLNCSRRRLSADGTTLSRPPTAATALGHTLALGGEDCHHEHLVARSGASSPLLGLLRPLRTLRRRDHRGVDGRQNVSVGRATRRKVSPEGRGTRWSDLVQKGFTSRPWDIIIRN